MTVRVRLATVCVGLMAILSAACGQGSFAPTAPSLLGGGSSGLPAPGIGSGAVISGTVAGGVQPVNGASFSTLGDRGLTVTVSGTNITATVDNGGRFTLTGVPGGNVTLKFSGHGSEATVTISSVAAGDQIEITVSLNGGSARVESERRHNGHSKAEIEGPIATIDTTARTIRVRDRLIEVPATAVIRRGHTTLTFADLKVNDQVHVRATVDAARVIATEVKLQDNDDDADEGLEIEGAISALDAAARTITVDRTVIDVPTTAVIRRRHQTLTFGDLKVGDEVEVHARVVGTKTIATRVKVEDDDDDDGDDVNEMKAEGVVSELGTAPCPDITFKVGTMVVRANSATRYEHGACAQVQNAVHVEVKGQRQPDGSLLASKVEIE